MCLASSSAQLSPGLIVDKLLCLDPCLDRGRRQSCKLLDQHRAPLPLCLVSIAPGSPSTVLAQLQPLASLRRPHYGRRHIRAPSCCTDFFMAVRRRKRRFLPKIIIAFKGAIRDFIQSPDSAENCLQHVRSSGPGTIVCKPRATHRALITCKCHVTCHLVRRDSSAVKFDRVEIAFI